MEKLRKEFEPFCDSIDEEFSNTLLAFVKNISKKNIDTTI